MSKFIMLCGLPGSSKSTWAETHKEVLNAVVHSSDAIRAELGNVNDQSKNELVFKILHQRVKDDLSAGKNVIYDTTNLSRKNRIHFIKNELRNIPCEKICVLFATPYEMCCARNFARDRQVPVEVLVRMYKNFEVPWYSEGWDDVQIVWADCQDMSGFEYDVCVDIERLKAVSHDNPHHHMSIGNHMLAACDYIKDKTDDERLIDSALLHDIGKPYVKAWENSKGESCDHATYYQHHNVGSYLSLFYLRNMHPEWSNKDILYVSLLINMHMRPLTAYKHSQKAKERDEKLFGSDFMSDLMLLNEADKTAH